MIVRDKIMPMAGEEGVVTFGGIAILQVIDNVPICCKDLYNVELHLSFLRLHGQANDFKIQYSSLNNQPHTLVVIILRLGKAKLCIPALYLQFEDNVVDLLLALSEGLLNMKYKESLLMSYKWKGSENNEARATEVVPVLPDDDDDAVDPHLERIKNEAGGDDSDEEDEDFVLNKDDGGSPTDDSGGDESDASAANHVWWLQKSAKKKPKKEATVSKPSTSRKKADGDASKKKKQKKKKDPNPPKKAISAFMYFLQSKRENVKKSNSGIAFYEVGRIIGERWNKLLLLPPSTFVLLRFLIVNLTNFQTEEKKPFEAMAKADKKCYSEQISDYRNLQPTAMDSGSESGCF
ncbi:FACT complex subunit SSRP1-like [Solanum verrucosum]|uniref:FACT complex subunit SSRP1-like n=1 Tax=Solanum verrucosum TaxID=315347 RepID=UPI0020CFEBB7|nr:FACT complex subunit SSRP1-like [Solanum verrucosum]